MIKLLVIPLNILEIDSEELNLLLLNVLRFRNFNEELPSNILAIYVTFDISKLDKSNEVNPKQPENIFSEFSSEDVSKFPKFIDVNFSHSSNIEFIYFISDVSKFKKSISVIALHP